MVINFQTNLNLSLQKISLYEHQEYLIHKQEIERTYHNSDILMQKYMDFKWEIVGLINEHFSSRLTVPVLLENWLNANKEDEVSYFLNEVGSNALTHSQFKTPSTFHLWLGKKGFVIGIEQNGSGFDAEKVNHHKIKSNEGAGFEFFRNSKSAIFFDNKNEARMVMMEVLLVSMGSFR